MKKTLLTLLCLLMLPLNVSAQESYELAYPLQNGYARIVQDAKWGLVDEKLNSVLVPKWDYLGECNENFRLIRSGNLMGFADETGKQVIAPQFDQVLNFSQGLAAVKNEEGKWGYINTQGTLIIPYLYEEANEFSDDLALIKQDGLYGYISAENNLVIPPSFVEAYPFSEGLACVKQEDKYGYINPQGEVAITPQFELAFDFSEGFAVVKSQQYGLIDKNGNWRIAPKWEHLSSTVNDGLLKAKKSGKTGFINTNGQTLTPYTYTDLGDFSDGFCPVQTNDGFGYLNNQFILEIPTVWENVGAFSEGLAPVQKNGLWGYVDTTGQLVVDYYFKDAGAVANGLAVVCTQEDEWQFINPAEFTPEVPATNDGVYDIDGSPNTLVLEIDHHYLYTPEGAVALEAAPTIRDDHTLLPIRAVIEAIGGTVYWDAAEQKITLKRNGQVVILQLNKTAAFVNGRITLLEAVPIIENDRTLSPLRFATETLGCTVDWNSETRRISISY